MNRSNVEHCVFALIMQLIPGLLFGDYRTGAAFAVGFFVSRGLTGNQTKLAFHKRWPTVGQLPYNVSDVPWYRSFSGWTLDSKLDLLFPVVTVGAVYIIHVFWWPK